MCVYLSGWWRPGAGLPTDLSAETLQQCLGLHQRGLQACPAQPLTSRALSGHMAFPSPLTVCKDLCSAWLALVQTSSTTNDSGQHADPAPLQIPCHSTTLLDYIYNLQWPFVKAWKLSVWFHVFLIYQTFRNPTWFRTFYKSLLRFFSPKHWLLWSESCQGSFGLMTNKIFTLDWMCDDIVQTLTTEQWKHISLHVCELLTPLRDLLGTPSGTPGYSISCANAYYYFIYDTAVFLKLQSVRFWVPFKMFLRV